MIQESSPLTPGKRMLVNWPDQRIVRKKRKQREEK
jgi:hypothetical protein